VWIGSLQSPQAQARQIFSGPASDLEWAPEAAHMLFFASDGLFTAAAPDYVPARVNEIGDSAGNPAWVWAWR
jgi:hypothetical protein